MEQITATDPPASRRRDWLASLPLAAGLGIALGTPTTAAVAVSGSPGARVIGTEHAARKAVDGASVMDWLARRGHDMSVHLPVIDPARIRVPVLIMRGHYDGIESFADLAAFFERLPHPDQQFVVMPGIAHTSTRSKNYALVYHLLDSYFSQPQPVYKG